MKIPSVSGVISMKIAAMAKMKANESCRNGGESGVA